jgi:hypothetical protein
MVFFDRINKQITLVINVFLNREYFLLLKPT